MKNPKSQLRFYCMFALGTVIASAGCTGKDSVLKKADDVKPVAVRAVPVVQTEVQQTTLQPATIHALYRAEIEAKATGFVQELKADIGDFVEAGTELAAIAVPEMHKQVLIVEARVRRFEAEERRALAGMTLAAAVVRSAKAKLSEAQSLMASADALLAAAEAEFSRTEDLVQRQSLQNRMLDEVRMKRDSELATKQAVLSTIESAKAEVVVAEAKQASAKADLEAAQAETEIARKQLEELEVLVAYSIVRAPFAGVVTERNVEPGNLVRLQGSAGSDRPLFVISQIDKVRVRIQIPESEAPLVNVGDEVTLSLPAFSSEQPLIGSVTRRSTALDPSTRTMLVEAEMDNSDGKLLPGMFGQASIQLSTVVVANMLPSQAIRFGDGGNAYVYVVGQDATVTVTEVKTGHDDGNSIQVLAGLELGQDVIDSHLKRFVDGQKVTVLTN